MASKPKVRRAGMKSNNKSLMKRLGTPGRNLINALTDPKRVGTGKKPKVPTAKRIRVKK